jgi:hypothetical protein
MTNFNTIKRLDIPKLRKAMRNLECTLNTPVCNYDRSTVVGCHINTEGGKMGGKSDDTSMVAGCSSCHDAIDGRTGVSLDNEERLYYTRRALTRTYRLLFDAGVIKV